MRRSDIPVRLRVARAADCAKIPDTALAKMAPADVAPRLLAADEYRRRARVPHLDGDLYRHRLVLASEVLTTADPKRAAELVKAAGVDPRPRPATPTGRTAPAARPRPSTLLAKSASSAAARSDRSPGKRHVPAWTIQADEGKPGVTVAVPALTRLARDSATVMERAGDAGLLGDLATEIGNIAKALEASRTDLPGRAREWERLAACTPDPVMAAQYRQRARASSELLGGRHGHLSKAVRYERQAAVMTSPADRAGYLELARQEREKAGAA